MRTILLAVVAVFALVLGGCGKDMSTDGGRPPVSDLQKAINTGQDVVFKLELGLMGYSVLPVCSPGRTVCRNPEVVTTVGNALSALSAALEVAQLVVNTGDAPSRIEQMRIVTAAVAAAMKALQAVGALQP